MKQETNLAQISRYMLWLGFIVIIGFTAARGQPSGTVIPRVCFEAKPETLTRTMTNSVSAGSAIGQEIFLNQALPSVGFYAFVLNPGGETEERLEFGFPSGSPTEIRFSGTGIPAQTFLNDHFPNETVLVISDGEAVYGYHNTSSTAVTIPRGVSSSNYFAPGPLVYSSQITNFQPGVHGNAFRLKANATLNPAWYLNGGVAGLTSFAGPGGAAGPTSLSGRSCATITYQGRLNDAGNAANGQFDLQFRAFETETDGAAQSGVITLENVQVTNGIFTVPLFFGSSFTGNLKPRFLQIGVRPGTSTDAFTVLTPRQPITQVPFAINAETAAAATTVVGATNLNTAGTVVQRDAAGNFTAGTITATTFNGTATNATNANQLGGVLAANYLTNTSTFGQGVTTASGTDALSITNATTAYTLVPGLTQTINVPANRSLLISTDGGIQSLGAISTFSVVDAAIFVDGVLAGERRIVISNFSVSLSVDNWALSLGQTLAAGSHTIEVRVRNGTGTGGQPATASGNSGSGLLQGRLTVAVIRH